jgi:hypothetical protein
MKHYLLLTCLLAACSHQLPAQYVVHQNLPEPPQTMYKLKGYDGPEAMSDAQALQASKQCIYAKLHPNIEYTSVKVDTGGKVLVPIAVHCEPYP